MIESIDAATIRELLARMERPEGIRWRNDDYPLLVAIAHYALELSDKVESQAAELERLRKENERLEAAVIYERHCNDN